MKCRHTKIVATLGPATSTKEKIRQLVALGVNVFRLNFSHGSHEIHQQNILSIRALEEERGETIGIIADLQGPKLRIGKVEEGTVLVPGDIFTLYQDVRLGHTEGVTFPHPEIYAHLVPGTVLLMDDGNLHVEVIAQEEGAIKTKVIIGGKLSSHKGVNIPSVQLPISSLTKKDRHDLQFILTQDVDFIALSFVQVAEDIHELRQLIPASMKILAKIEKPLAIQHITAITEAADGLMVARGDLGVEMAPEEVPTLQKRLIHVANQYGKPVVVATQMLESMVHHPRPTRAEASDVANAVYDGADAVMLSAETAAGKYPQEVVAMMAAIIRKTEEDHLFHEKIDALSPLPETTTSDAITHAAWHIAHSLNVELIATFTASGSTVLRMARQRPLKPIIGLSTNQNTARFLTLVWGVTPYVVEPKKDIHYMIHFVAAFCLEKQWGKVGDQIVITGGNPVGIEGTTNFLQVETLKTYGKKTAT